MLRGSFNVALGLGLGALVDERLVDVRDDAAARDGGLDERVKLLVPADGQLRARARMARSVLAVEVG